MRNYLLSIIIPVYRNEGSISKIYTNVSSALKDIPDRFSHEIIFINDGSDDESLAEILKIKKIDKKVKVIDFVRNFGQTSAILAGFEHAKGDVLIHIAADLQDPPQLIPEMISKWKEGFKIVAGKRKGRDDSFLTRVTSKIFYSIIKMLVPKMPEGGFDYYLLDKIVYKAVLNFDERNSFIQGDFLWLGYEPHFIPYRKLRRQFGKSQWSLTKKVKFFIDGIINTSYAPIRFMSLFGLATSFIGFVYAIMVLVARISNQIPIQGYAPIVIILLIFLGLIMIMLGIIGEYIWRIYDEIKKRPRYIVKKTYL